MKVRVFDEDVLGRMRITSGKWLVFFAIGVVFVCQSDWAATSQVGSEERAFFTGVERPQIKARQKLGGWFVSAESLIWKSALSVLANKLEAKLESADNCEMAMWVAARNEASRQSQNRLLVPLATEVMTGGLSPALSAFSIPGKIVLAETLTLSIRLFNRSTFGLLETKDIPPEVLRTIVNVTAGYVAPKLTDDYFSQKLVDKGAPPAIHSLLNSLIDREDGVISRTETSNATSRSFGPRSGLPFVKVNVILVYSPYTHFVTLFVRGIGDACPGKQLFILQYEVNKDGLFIKGTLKDRPAINVETRSPQSENKASKGREGIVFQRSGNLWIMDNYGNNQRQVTREGVGRFSVSRVGTVVYDRFRPGQLIDLNVYMLSLADDAVKQLTSDNQNIEPFISPNGEKVIFQKYQWGGAANYIGVGKGLWIIDLATGKEEAIVGVVPIPGLIKEQRNKLYGILKKGGMDETRWIYDEHPFWSPDSMSFMFLRRFEQGGVVRFYVDLKNREQLITPPDEFNPFGLDLFKSQMLYFHNASFSFHIYDIATNRSHVLAKKVSVGAAKFSPDGNDIVFEVRSGRHAELSELWITKRNGADKRKITTQPISSIQDISWSLDGKRILFACGTGKVEIWTIRADGSDLRKIADDASYPKPTWIGGSRQSGT